MKKASTETWLLDVNVLLALAWPNHQFHAAAISALGAHAGVWATCALTQLGFIRLSSNRAAIAEARRPAEAAAMLARITADPRHRFLPTMPAPAKAPCLSVFSEIVGHQQVTDAYLTRVAAAHEAVFITFDRRLENYRGAQVRVLS